MQPTFNSDLFRKALFFILVVFCLSPYASSPVALALGIAFTIIIRNPYEEKVHKYIHLLLQISIVGLGFGLQLNEALKAGREGITLTVLSITTVMVLGYFLGKLLKIERPLSYLVSVGTAICG